MIRNKQASALTCLLVAAVFCQPAAAWQVPCAEPHGAQAADGLPGLGTSAADALVAYGEDLSRLRVPDRRPRQMPPVDTRAGGAKSATRTLPLSPDQLRALFHRPEFNRTDRLAAYHDDPAWRPRGPAVRRGMALSNQRLR